MWTSGQIYWEEYIQFNNTGKSQEWYVHAQACDSNFPV